MKKLAVIILNWNGKELLERFLPGVVADTLSDEADVIVADNGSDDGSLQWLRDNHPEVGIIELDRNYGFSEGYNRAIAQVKHPYVTLLNSDVETTPGWWRPVLDFMSSHPDAAAVQPKILSLKDKSKFEYAGAAGGYLDALGYPYCRGRLFDITETDNGQYDGEPVEVAWASGACLTVRRDAYLQTGGLDASFFAHMEEIDLCLRLIAAGYKVYALTDSAVYHLGGASLNQGNPQKTYLNFRNNLFLLRKNLTRSRGARKIFLRRLADTLAFMMFILKGDMANARAVLRAHSDFRKMRRDYKPLEGKDFYGKLPGAGRHAVISRYLLGKKSLHP